MAGERGHSGEKGLVLRGRERIGNEEVEVWKGDFVLFWKPPTVFGQWTPSTFEVDGKMTNTH